MYAAIGAEHPQDFLQVEGNTFTNSGETCTGDDLSNSLIYRNDFGPGTTLAFQPWIYLPGSTATGNTFVYNALHDFTAGSAGAIDVHAINGTVEISNNTFVNVVTGNYFAIYASSLNTNIFGNNSYTNTPMHEFYVSYSNQIWSPSSLAFTASSPTSATVQASGGWYVPVPYPNPPTQRSNFIFQKAEYDGTNINLTTGTSQSSDTATFGSLNPNYGYAFRVKAVYPGEPDSAWTEWIYRYEGQISITTGSLPNGTAGVAYSQTLAATGGTTPYTWAIASGTLPAGLTLSSAGIISGTPSTAMSQRSITFRVTDSIGTTATRRLLITIRR
jgi:hypothetical protein